TIPGEKRALLAEVGMAERQVESTFPGIVSAARRDRKESRDHMQHDPASGIPPLPVWERLKLSSFTVDSLYALGFNSLTAGQLARAEQYFLMLCLLDSGAAQCYLGYGRCYDQRGRMMMVGHLFQSAIEHAPDWPVPYYHLARTHVARNDQAAARTALDRF